MFNSGDKPEDIIKAKGLVQISDTAEIERMIDEVIAASPKEHEQYRAGKTALMGYFVGQVMKKSNGRANPKSVNEILKSRLQ